MNFERNNNANQALIDEMVRSFQYMLEQGLKTTTKCYDAVIRKDNQDGTYELGFNGEVHNLPVYSDFAPNIGEIVKIFIPQGNMNVAYVLPKNKPGEKINLNDYLTKVSAAETYANKSFSTVTVGETVIASENKSDNLTILAGDNVVLTPNATNKTLTISSINAGGVYTPANASIVIGGTTTEPTIAVGVSEDTGNILDVKDDGLFATVPSTYATKQDLEQAIAEIGTVFNIKGAKPTVSDLPQTGNKQGDVWYVEDESAGYIWLITEAHPNGYWEQIGPTIDLSGYLTKAGLAQTTGNATDNTMSQKAISDALNTKVDKVSGKGLSTNDYTTADKNKLSGIEAGAEVNIIEGVQVNGDNLTVTDKKVNVTVASGSANGTISVNGKDVSVKGLGSAAYTNSTAYDAAGSAKAVQGNTTETVASVASKLGDKVDKVSGKGLSTNDFTNADKTKLDGIATGAEVNQNAFSNITVGTTTIAADTKTDTLTIIAGSNVTLTPNATNDSLTIASTNTTYSAGTGISISGTTISNSGVRGVGTSDTLAAIKVNTNGTDSNVAIRGLSLVGGRPTDANVDLKNNTTNGAYLMLATGSMTSNKPYADGFITTYSWDTDVGWGAQLFLPTIKGEVPQYRVSTAANNVQQWGSWKNFITEDNYTSYFTDTKVTQTSVTASDYTYWRPLIFGASSSATAGFAPTTVTDGVLATTSIQCQPSTGTIRANEFTGNAATASSWATARTITLGGQMQGSVSIKGDGNVTLNAYNYYASIQGGNTDNYPWRRIATIAVGTGQFIDKDVLLRIRGVYINGAESLVKINVRTESLGAACSCNVRWLYRSAISADRLAVGLWGKTGDDVVADIYYKVGKWPRTIVQLVSLGRECTLINSYEPNNTTDSDKKGGYEIYTSVANGGELIRNITYTTTYTAVDSATVYKANTATTAASADKLNTNAGSTTQPIYFSNGVPVATSYELGAKVSGYYGGLNVDGWKTLGGRTNGRLVSVSSCNDKKATWNSSDYSSSIVFGASDTKGLLDCAYNNAVFTIGGGAIASSTDNDPYWHMKFSGTSGCTYTLPTVSKTLAATDGSNATGTWGISVSGSAKGLRKADNTILTDAELDDFITASQITYSLCGGGLTGLPTDGMIITVPWGSTNYGHQFYIDDETYTIKHRNKSTNWKEWKTIIDESNIGSQSVSYANNAGSATSASKLTTARTIGLDTAVTSTATSFNGEANITIPVTNVKEAYLSWGGKNIAGSFSPIDGAMIPNLGANRLAFSKAEAVTIEYSRDSGSTWTDYGANEATKINLFNNVNTSLVIGKATSAPTNAYQLRITLDTNLAPVYTVLNKFCIFVSTESSGGCWCTIRARLRSDQESNTNNWKIFADKAEVSGWSGYNIINTSGITTYGNSKTIQYGQIQFIFGITFHTSSSYNGLRVLSISGYGGVGWTTPSTLAKNGHLYSYNENQSATFPNNVTATGNVIGSNIKSKGSATQPIYFDANGVAQNTTYTLGASVPANAKFTDTTYNFSGTNFYSGGSNTAEHNCNNIASNGHFYYTSNGPSASLGAKATDGGLYSQAYSVNWVAQIAQDYKNGRPFFRGKNSGTWQSWVRGCVTTTTDFTLSTTWTGSSAPYYQQFTVAGMTATDYVTLYPQWNATASTAKNEQIAWNNLINVQSFDGYFRVYSNVKTTTTVTFRISY